MLPNHETQVINPQNEMKINLYYGRKLFQDGKFLREASMSE